jgi:hypothetical protein
MEIVYQEAFENYTDARNEKFFSKPVLVGRLFIKISRDKRGRGG